MRQWRKAMGTQSTITAIKVQGLLAPCVLIVAAACSGGGPANTLCVPAGGKSVASNLALSPTTPRSTSMSATGTGFIDIETKDASGEAKQKRCTMTLRPIDDSNTSVRVWTAGHCAYDPHTEEFKNSKYTLKVFYKNGYFSVPVQFEGFESLAKIADFAANPIISSKLPDLKSRLRGAMPSSAPEVCLKHEATFKEQLGSSAKNVACFSRDEMRGLKASLTPDEKVKPYLVSVLDELRDQESSVMSSLDQNLKRTLYAYQLSHTSEQRRIADLRSLAYILSEGYCSASENDRMSAKSEESDKNTPDVFEACGIRAIARSVLESALPNEFPIIQSVLEDTTTPLHDLRKKTMGCNGIDVNNIASVSDLTKLTPCDMGELSKSIWKKYVDRGPTFSGAEENASKFGLSGLNYYGFYTNTIEARRPPVARLFSLNATVVSNFEYAMRPESKDHDDDVFLINYDKNSQSINPVKGASGSILSIFGSIPAALLSTVDGEATSGGAGITPLPEISDDDVPPASNAGC